MTKKRGLYGKEFPQHMIDDERSRAGLTEPGEAEVHHIVPAAEASRLGISRDMTRSRYNLKVLTKEDHRKLHRGWAPIPRKLVKLLQKLQPQLFPLDPLLAPFPERKSWRSRKRREKKAAQPSPQLSFLDELESTSGTRRSRREKKKK